MKAVVPAIFPVRLARLELAVSGNAEEGEYLVAALAYTADGLRIANKRLSWPQHSPNLAVPTHPLPALTSEVTTVVMEVSLTTPATTLQFEIIDWRRAVAEPAIEIHSARWFATAQTNGLHALGVIDGKEWL